MSKSFTVLLLLIAPFFFFHASVQASTTVTISLLPPESVSENGGSLIFVIRRTGDLPQMKVSYKVSGTAKSGTDFTAPSGLADFAQGAATANVSIIALDDVNAEPDETVIVTVIPPVVGTSYQVGSPASATATITDDEPTVTLTATGIAEEHPATILSAGASFNIHRTGPTTTTLRVDISVSGTATSGTDYQTITTPVQLGNRVSTLPISVNVKEDLVVDPDETVEMSITPSKLYHTGTPNEASITIKDNDPPTMSFTVPDATAEEKGQTTATIRVNRTGDLQRDVVVTYLVNPPGTLSFPATSGTDFVALPGSITVPAGSDGANIVITPIDDNEIEPNENVLLHMSSSPNYQQGTTISASVSITSDDLPFVNISVVDGIGSEPGTDTATFRISRTGSTAASLVVGFNLPTTAANVATRGTDYTLPVRILGNSITIPAGASSFDIVITPIDDSIQESQEQVIMAIAPGGYTIGANGSATIFISDND